ncbi:MAG: DUF885 domain-containing protein [Gammaproteobacteria bacterium]
MRAKPSIYAAIAVFFVASCAHNDTPPIDHNAAFDALAQDVVERLPALSPIGATALGDHRFDALFDDISPASRAAAQTFYQTTLQRLDAIESKSLNRENQIDATLLRQDLRGKLWRQETLREWSWNPLIYTGLAGGSVYSLMARDFAPLEERLKHATARLEQLPRFLKQVRATLDVKNVPLIHAETAVKQNGGVTSIIDALIRPQLDQLGTIDRARMNAAIKVAVAAVDEHQDWLEQQLVPNARGEFRIGAEKFDQKLSFTLFSPLSRQDVRQRAEREFKSVREQMYQVARSLVEPGAPDNPSPEKQQAVIEAGLALAYARVPGRDDIVTVARQSLQQSTEFVREKNLVEVPNDPVEIIIMPEFQRGIALAYCDAPGALDRGQKTFYAVAPLPAEWTDEQVNSFLREYNLLSIENLTIHEAMPGHYLQLALSNRHPSVLRAMLASGPFIEGWAVYSESVMINAGYLDNDPLMRLINQKWYLRAVANSIIDQAVHVDGMTRDEAMSLMIDGAFQEEREAAGKWVRAQLTSAQLSTYFVGYQEHADLRREMEQHWGDDFTLRRYHDEVLSYGSPPVQFVRAQLLGAPIPEH